jgi:hypothetical protein
MKQLRRRIWLSLGLVAPLGLAVSFFACTGDDDVFRPTDASTFEGGSNFDQSTSPVTDGGPPALACGDAGGAPPRVFLIQGTPRTSELAVVNVQTKAVDGRLTFDGGYGTTSSLGTDPYLLGGESDIVQRLDAREPWKVVGSWNVRGDDVVADGGDRNANPVAVVQTSCSKAYVLRFNRDRIAIIDPSRPSREGVGGVPTGYIDLTALKQPGDPNFIEMTSAVYVPSKKRVYVLLGNADLTRTKKVNGPFGEETKLLCAPLKPSIIAIDVDTDKVVTLGGTAPGGGIALDGYNPPLGTPLIYDAAFDRLLVLHAGCNEELLDSGVGNITRRRVEQVDLATGAIKTLLSLDGQGFPSSLAFVDGDHAAVAFYFDGYHWDPHQTTLGASIKPGIDIVANDGRGAFFGTRATFFGDGGAGPLEVLAVPLSDAGTTSLIIADPFTKAGGYVAGIEAWPHP